MEPSPLSQIAEEPHEVFVGRANEQRLLLTDFASVRGGKATVAIVEGMAGVGKTALLNRFLTDASRHAVVVRAFGEEAQRDRAYGVVTQLISMLPQSQNHFDEVLRAVRSGGDPMAVGGRLLAALGDLQADGGVVVIVVDDAHLADAPSTRALTFMIRRLLADRTMVVCASRSGELSPLWQPVLEIDRTRHLILNGLDSTDLITFARTLGVELSRRNARLLHERTDGHPLYVAALLSDASFGSQLRGQGEGPLISPPDLTRLIESSLARCSSGTQRLVAAAAVLGPECSLVDAVWLAGVDKGELFVEEAVIARLLQEVTEFDDGRVRFVHPLVHAAIYEDLGSARRYELHRLAAQVSSGSSQLWHRFSSTVGFDDALANDLEAAAGTEMDRADRVSAGQHLRQASVVSSPGSKRERRTLDAAAAFLSAGEAERARALEASVADSSPGPYRDYVLGYLALTSGRMGEATALFRAAWDATQSAVLSDGPDDLAGRIATHLTILSVLDLRLADIERWGEAALATAEIDELSLSFAWYARSFALGATGRMADALAMLGRDDAPGGIDVIMGLGLLRLWSDDLFGARETFRLAYARARGGEPLRVTQGLAFLGETEYRLGNLDEAVVVTELAVEAMHDAGRTWDYPVIHALAAYPLAARGNIDQAERHALAARQWADLVPVAANRAYAAGARIAVALARGDHEELLSAAGAMQASYPGYEPGTNCFGPVLAEALVELGRIQQGKQEIDRYERQTRLVGRRSALLGVARMRGVVAALDGDHDLAEHHFAEGDDFAAGLDLPLEHGRLDAAHGRALQLAGDAPAARDRYQRALTRFEGLRAQPYAAKVRERLLDLGVTPREEPPPAFTPSEAAVVRLVAEGLSNRVVADELVVSVKTVEYHLSNIYRRLGISSRTQLTRLVLAQPG